MSGENERASDEPLFVWTFLQSRTDLRPGLRISWSRDEFLAQLANPLPAQYKERLPLLCPATFRGNRRGNKYVEQVHALCLDIDDPCSDPEARMRAISSALGGVEVFVHSTFRSQPGAYKLRAIIPLDAPTSAEDHRASWAYAARALHLSGIEIDRACCEPARGFFVYAIPPNGVYYTGHLEGDAWPAAQAASFERDRVAAERAKREQANAERARKWSKPGGRSARDIDRARAYVDTMPPAISGAGGHNDTWRVARAVVADFGLNDADALDVLREYNERCQPPWSERELLHKLHDARNARVSRDMGAAS